MRLSPSFLSIRATDARLTASRKVVVSIVALTISVIGTGKKFLGLVYLNFFISFSIFVRLLSLEVGLFTLSFTFIILGCISYLLIIKSIADESSIFVS